MRLHIRWLFSLIHFGRFNCFNYFCCHYDWFLSSKFLSSNTLKVYGATVCKFSCLAAFVVRNDFSLPLSNKTSTSFSSFPTRLTFLALTTGNRQVLEIGTNFESLTCVPLLIAFTTLHWVPNLLSSLEEHPSDPIWSFFLLLIILFFENLSEHNALLRVVYPHYGFQSTAYFINFWEVFFQFCNVVSTFKKLS